jgi:hypothetical protein
MKSSGAFRMYRLLVKMMMFIRSTSYLLTGISTWVCALRGRERILELNLKCSVIDASRLGVVLESALVARVV